MIPFGKSALQALRAAVLGAAAAIGAGRAPGAVAQWAVFDASNFAKNALTAAQTANMVAQQLRQFQTQLLQYATQLQNLNQIPTSVWTSELGRELAAQGEGCTDIACVRRGAGELADVYRTAALSAEEGANLYRRSADFGWDLSRFSEASGMTPEQIFRYERQRAQAGLEGAETQFDTAKHLQEQLATWQQKADRNAQAAQNAQGARDALQALAAQTHLQTTQLSSLLDLEAVNAQSQAANAAHAAQEKAKASELYNEAQRRMQSYYRSAGVTSGIQVTR